MGFFDFATKGIDKVKSEELNYDPADAKPLLDQLYNKKNRGLGFYKTVEKRYENFEDKGPGTLYVSDNNGKPNYRFFPDMGKEFIDEQNLRITRAEGIANAPLHLAPLLALGTGVPKIIQSKTQQKIDYAKMYAKESNLNNPINLKQSIDGVFSMPSQKFNRIRTVLRKNPGMSYKDAADYVDLVNQGIVPTKPIKPGNITGITNKGLMKGGEGPYDPNKDEVYIPPEERIGTQKGDPLEARFQYQGNFMFGPRGEIHWNKIDPAGKVAWEKWLQDTATKSGYASMKEMIKIMREWPEQDYQDFMNELWVGADGAGNIMNRFTYTGYAEHKKAKASKKGRLDKIQQEHPDWNQNQIASELARKSLKTTDMDWLHDTTWIDHTGTIRTDGIGLGDRNDPKNMLALFDSQWKSLKDVSEQLGYGSEERPGPLVSFSDGTWRNPKQRFYIDVQDPGKQKQYLRQNPGEIVIKRADNHKVVGNLGAYLRALYPMDRRQEEDLKWGALRSINPNTGKNFTSLREFREYIILERINIILRDTVTLPPAYKTDSTKRKRYITQKIQEDMVDLGEKYPFLRSIPEWIENSMKTDYDEWRGVENKDLPKLPKNFNINIGGTKAGGTLKKTEDWYQTLLDDLFGNDR